MHNAAKFETSMISHSAFRTQKGAFSMNKMMAMLGGLGIGAGLMYLADPDRGRRRRALLRDKMKHCMCRSRDVLDAAAEDMNNRTHGMMAEAEARARDAMGGQMVTDQVLCDRVRSAMGRVVSHPGAITVTADKGHVTLSGLVMAQEFDDLMNCTMRVRGVKSVRNNVQVRRDSGDESSLQGNGHTMNHRPLMERLHRSPAFRVGESCLGGALALRGMMHGGMMGKLESAIGLGLLARATTNMDAARMIGVNHERCAVEMQKTMTIAAPVDEVWNFWAHFENFPRFMSHLKHVKDMGNGRSHWSAVGPGNMTCEWDAVITKWDPPHVMAWRSTEGSLIANAGMVRFEEVEGGTRLDIRLSYNPPGGALGHMCAALFGADPKHAMDQDLVRLKSLLECGKSCAHGHKVTREELDTAEAPHEMPMASMASMSGTNEREG